MTQTDLLAQWRVHNNWVEPYDPTRLQMALHKALIAVRTAFQKGQGEVALTGIFFSTLDQTCMDLENTFGASPDGPLMEGLIFNTRNKATSEITETKLGADFALGFWQPDRTLRLAIFQAKKVKSQKINIGQVHKPTGTVQALALLSTALRAPGAANDWASAYWAHYVGWDAQAWESVWQLSNPDMCRRLVSLAGIEVTDIPTFPRAHLVPIQSNQPRFFDVLSAGAGADLAVTNAIAADHWLTLTLAEASDSQVFVQMLGGMQTYFIYDRAHEFTHRQTMDAWVKAHHATRSKPFVAMKAQPRSPDEDDDTTGAAPPPRIRLPGHLVTPSVALEAAGTKLPVPSNYQGALARAQATFADTVKQDGGGRGPTRPRSSM